MDKIVFTAETREDTGKGAARKLRAAGFIPCVLYGAGQEPCSIKIEKRSAENIIRKLESHNVMVDLILNRGGKEEMIKTMLKDVQIEPIKLDVLHLDFYRIRMDKQVRMEVAVHLEGEAPGVEKGGILEQEIREIEVQALPDRIPSMIVVDVSKLDIGDSITLQDIVLPEGVETVEDKEKIVVTVLAPKAVEEEKPAEGEEGVEKTAETVTEPEVISEKEAAERRKEKEAEKTEKQ